MLIDYEMDRPLEIPSILLALDEFCTLAKNAGRGDLIPGMYIVGGITSLIQNLQLTRDRDQTRPELLEFVAIAIRNHSPNTSWKDTVSNQPRINSKL